jgi:hypothetical protein
MEATHMISSVSGSAQASSTSLITPAAKSLADTAKAQQAAQQDQVNISKLVQKFASDGDTQAQEARESGAEKASESARNKA